MTQEEKSLLLKDLCARLPYGVICYDEAQNETGIFKQFEYEGFGRIHNGRGMRYIEHIHPILRPMSSMTEEEKNELYTAIDWYGEIGETGNVYTKGQEKVYRETFYEYTDWLNAHHFDYRNLIERGLAIAVTEENNPYKE